MKSSNIFLKLCSKLCTGWSIKTFYILGIPHLHSSNVREGINGFQEANTCRIILQYLFINIEKWMDAQCAFIMEMFFKNNDSYVNTIHVFRKHFKVRGKNAMHLQPTVKLWVKNFCETELAWKKISQGGNDQWEQ